MYHMLSLKEAAALAVPIVMKTAGTVVPGVGTIHAPVTRIVQMFAAGTVGPSVSIVIVIGVAGGATYWYFTKEAPLKSML